MASTRALVTMAVVGAPLSLFGALYFTSRREAEFVKMSIYSEALNVLRHYKPAVEHLGLPIQPKNLYPWNRTENYSGRFVSKLSVPVRGTKGTGELLVYGVRSKASEDYVIDHLDLHLDQVDKTWTFYVVKHSVSIPSFEELYAKSLSAQISGVTTDDATAKLPVPAADLEKMKYLEVKKQ